MDHNDQFFFFSHLLCVCLGSEMLNLLYVSMQAWLSVWIITLLSVDTVSKAVAIAVVSALVEEDQFSTPTACQLPGLKPLACI